MKHLRSVFEQTRMWADKNKVEIIAKDQLESTNTFAKENLKKFEQKLQLIICDDQTHGRGRGDNSWLGTAPGFSMFSSWVYKLSKPPQAISSPIIGVAVYEAFKKVWPKLNWSIKAPNDIYINDKKVCGILLETVSINNSHCFIIGLGANILKHPNKVETSTDLVSHLQDFITTEHWDRFLTELKTLFNSCLRTIINKELEKADQIMLKKALNACPYYTDPIIEIGLNGDIIFENSRIHWLQL